MTRFSSLVLSIIGAASLGCGGGGTAGDSPDAAIPPTPDAPTFQTCEGACQTTSLAATFGAVTRHLDRAFFGVTKNASGTTLHLEAHAGGTATCPTESSPTPAYTLVLGAVPVPTSAAPSTSPGSFLDYVGDLLATPFARADQVMITPVAAQLCTTCIGLPPPSDPGGMVALDVTLTFPTGTLAGHLYAIHCDSMDLQEP